MAWTDMILAFVIGALIAASAALLMARLMMGTYRRFDFTGYFFLTAITLQGGTLALQLFALYSHYYGRC